MKAHYTLERLEMKKRTKYADIWASKDDKTIRITQDVLEFINQGYCIEMERIKTRAALIEWVHHLLGKTWITTAILEDFIETIHDYRGWKLYNDV